MEKKFDEANSYFKVVLKKNPENKPVEFSKEK